MPRTLVTQICFATGRAQQSADNIDCEEFMRDCGALPLGAASKKLTEPSLENKASLDRPAMSGHDARSLKK